MKIALSIAYISLKDGGIAVYTRGLIDILLESGEVNELILCHSIEQKDLVEDLALKHPKIRLVNIGWKENFFSRSRMKISRLFADIHQILSAREMNVRWLRKWTDALNPIRSIVENLNINLFITSESTSPIYNLKNIPVFIVLHDVQELKLPEFFSPAERIVRGLKHKEACENATGIICSYDHIRDDLISYFRVPVEKIFVCEFPIRHWVGDVNLTTNEELFLKFKLQKPFLLYPAQTWKHKNHQTLIAAFKKIRDQGRDIELVFTGYQNSFYPVLQKYILELNLDSHIKFLGVVSKEELITLYRNTALVVVPTLYEAGSGLLFEAFFHEVPVICSNITSLPSAMNDERYIFDPLNADQIAEMIQKFVWNDTNRKDLISHIQRRKQELLKADGSSRFVAAYRSARLL